MGYNVDDLYLGDSVTPIYRPDMKDVAYYEFQVLKATRLIHDRNDLVDAVAKLNVLGAAGHVAYYNTPSLPAARLNPILRKLSLEPVQGFIMVSTGPHDFPIPHWSLDHAPVSVDLETRTKGKIKRIYKLDALAYVAEDARSKQLATVGQTPVMVSGGPADLLKSRGQISGIQPADFERDHTPDSRKMSAAKMVSSGPKRPNIKLKGFSSWATLKRNYAKTLRPMLNAVRAQAEKSWAVELAARKLGEGIRTGERRTFALLEPGATVAVSGDGAKMVQVRIVKRPKGTACVELTCKNAPVLHEVSFSLTITYASRAKEQLEFFIYSPTSPTRNQKVAEEG